jgi:hypothetical protein
MAQLNLLKTTTSQIPDINNVGMYIDENGVAKTIDENGVIKTLGGVESPLKDNNDIKSVDYNNRILYDSNENAILDWENNIITPKITFKDSIDVDTESINIKTNITPTTISIFNSVANSLFAMDYNGLISYTKTDINKKIVLDFSYVTDNNTLSLPDKSGIIATTDDINSVLHNSLIDKDTSGNHSLIAPLINSETAFKITKADGITSIFNVDSTNNRISINRENPVNCLEVGMEDTNDTNYITVFSDTDKTRGFSIDDANGYKWAQYVYKNENGSTLYIASGNSGRDILTMQSGGRVGLNVPTLLSDIEILRIVQTSGNTYATVTTEVPHKLANNTLITIEGAVETKFNGNFVITNITTITFRINQIPIGAITEYPTDAKVISDSTIPAAFSIFPQYFDSVYTFDKALDTGAGTGYNNITSEMRTSFGTETILPITVGSYLYLGKLNRWRATSINIQTASAGSTSILVEYSTESGWTALTTSTTSGNSLVDGTSRLTKDGSIRWNLKTFSNLWKPRIIQIDPAPYYTQNLHWIRISLNSLTTAPIAYAISNHGIDRLGVYAQASDINPTFAVDNLGKVVISPAELTTKYTAGNLNGLTSSLFEVVAEDGNKSDYIYYLANNNAASHSAIIMAKSKGTIETKTAVANGDDLGAVYGFAYDGTTFREAAGILFENVGTPVAGSISGRIAFKTRNTTSSSTEKMRITELGNVGIANTNPTEKLDVTGNIKASGYINGLKSGVFAFLPIPTNTTITTAGTYYPIAGTFNNPVIENFTVLATPAIRYDGTLTQYFKIDWHSTILVDNASTIITIGIYKNGSLVTGSNMSHFCKNANELYSHSGTSVISLATNNTIQLVITSDGDGDVLTVNNFTTTINEFFD